MEIDKLRNEYYQLMGRTQPFGNEYHEEVFNWIILKINEKEAVIEQLDKTTDELAQSEYDLKNKLYNIEQKLVACETILEEKTKVIESAIHLMKALKLFRTLSPDSVTVISECIQIIEGLDNGDLKNLTNPI